MNTNDDVIAGRSGAASSTRPAPGSKPRARSRKPGRARNLLSAVLRRPGRPARTVMICQSCELTGGPFSPAEAALLLSVHEQMHHGVAQHRPHLPPAV